MKTKSKPQEKVKFVAKSKNKSAPKTKSVHKPPAHKSAPKKAAMVVKNIEKGALAPSMDNDWVTVSDRFRFGEYKDNGLTTETGAGVRQNQIFLQLPVNPRRLLAVAKLNDVLKDQVPIIYKSESYNENSYQYRIDSAELTLSGVMPTSVSGEVCAFYTSNLAKQITETNVLDAYESSKHKICVSGKQIKSLKFSTGTLFINDDQTSKMAPDPSLCYAGLLTVFVRSPVVASQAVASSVPNGDPDFQYLGPMMQASMKIKTSYKGFEYAPQNVNTMEGSGYDQQLFDTHIVPSPMVVAGPDDDILVCPTFAVPPDLESSVVTTAYIQTNGGEWLGTTGDRAHPSFNLRLHNVPPHLDLVSKIFPLGFGTIDLFSWSSFTGFIQSAFSKLADLDNNINGRFVSLFGEVAGNALYNIGKKIVTAAISYATGGFLVADDGTGRKWDSDGYPLTNTGAITTGPVLQNSTLYDDAVRAFLVSGQTNYISVAQAQGVPPSFMNVMNTNYFHSDALRAAYIGSSGKIGAWTKKLYGYTEVKPSFGQPTSIGTTQVVHDPSFVSQRPSDHLTRTLGADRATTISFFITWSLDNGVNLHTSEGSYPFPATPTLFQPDGWFGDVNSVVSHYGLCDLFTLSAGADNQHFVAMEGHLTFIPQVTYVPGVTFDYDVTDMFPLVGDDTSHPVTLVMVSRAAGGADLEFLIGLRNSAPATMISIYELSQLVLPGAPRATIHFVGRTHRDTGGLVIPVSPSNVVRSIEPNGPHPLRLLKDNKAKILAENRAMRVSNSKAASSSQQSDTWSAGRYDILNRPSTEDKKFLLKSSQLSSLPLPEPISKPENDSLFWLKGLLDSQGLYCAREIGMTCSLPHAHTEYINDP